MTSPLQAMLGSFMQADPREKATAADLMLEGELVQSKREDLAMRFAVAMVGNPAMASYLNSHETRAIIAVRAADAVLARLEATAPGAPGADSPTEP